ncbi:MAG: MFS transporter [Desulfurococcales archaeon]|nr:MFS transporter [Desulfurococcales archaeon]
MDRKPLPLLVIASWLIYILFYLCRVNYSIAFPLAIEELGLDYCIMGVIAGSFFLVYSLGQVVNGYIVTRKGPWFILFTGTISSGLVNILYGYISDVRWFMILWILNGYFQSTAWTSLIRILTVALERNRLGGYMGFFNTSWALGSFITWIVTGYTVSLLGWRHGFIVNGLVLLTLGPILILILKHWTGYSIEAFYKKESLGNNIVLRNLARYWKPILFLAITYFLSTGILYAAIVYLPSYLYTLSGSTTISSTISSICPFSGALGMILYGYILDRYCGREKIKPILLSIPLATITLYALPVLAGYGMVYAGVMLVAIGLLVYGMNAQLITTIPATLINRKIIPLSIGIIDAAGSLGSFISNTTTGYLIDIHGFTPVFIYWSLWIILMALPLLILLHISVDYVEKS